MKKSIICRQQYKISLGTNKDYGHTMTRSSILYKPNSNSNPNPKYLDIKVLFFVKIMAD